LRADRVREASLTLGPWGARQDLSQRRTGFPSNDDQAVKLVDDTAGGQAYQRPPLLV
jgi:hypothetical protein